MIFAILEEVQVLQKKALKANKAFKVEIGSDSIEPFIRLVFQNQEIVLSDFLLEDHYLDEKYDRFKKKFEIYLGEITD